MKIRDRAAAKMASGLSDVMLHGCLMLEATVHRVSDEIRAVNDLFFGALDAVSFAALSAAAGALVESSAKAVRYISPVQGSPQSLRDAG